MESVDRGHWVTAWSIVTAVPAGLLVALAVAEIGDPQRDLDKAPLIGAGVAVVICLVAAFAPVLNYYPFSAPPRSRPPDVRIERAKPDELSDGRMLRLRVCNDSPWDVTLYGQVVGLENGTQDPPWDLVSRSGNREWPIPGESNEIVNFAGVTTINMAAARERAIEQWRPGFAFATPGDHRFAPFPDVQTVDQVAGRDMVAVVRVYERASGKQVAQNRVALFYAERDGGLFGDLRVDPPA